MFNKNIHVQLNPKKKKKKKVKSKTCITLGKKKKKIEQPAVPHPGKKKKVENRPASPTPRKEKKKEVVQSLMQLFPPPPLYFLHKMSKQNFGRPEEKTHGSYQFSILPFSLTNSSKINFISTFLSLIFYPPCFTTTK